MDSCPHCNNDVSKRRTLNYGVGAIVYEFNESYPYCSRQCFDAAIDEAIEREEHHCRFRVIVEKLRDDADKRVKNLEALQSNKVSKTKEYFQARADVLNDVLMFMEPDSRCSCIL